MFFLQFFFANNTQKHFANHWHEFREKLDPQAYSNSAYTINQAVPIAPANQAESSDEPPKPRMMRFGEIPDMNREKIVVVKSRFGTLDAKIGGFNKGELSIWSGGNASGKSTLVSQLGLAAIDDGYKVAMFSGEMTAPRVKEWMLLQAAGPQYVEEDKLNPNHYAVKACIKKRIEEYLANEIAIYNNDFGTDWEQVVQTIEDWIKANNSDVVIIDNLMALDITSSSADKYDIQSKIVKRFALLAKKQSVHIHFICHPRKTDAFLRKDDISGIAGVQVNGLLFTTVENGVLDIRIADVLSKYEHLAIRAFDYAGNFSNPVTLDNPCYKPESTSTAKPVSTPKAQTTDAFESISTPEPYRFIDEPFTSVTETATPQIVYVEPAATPTPVIQTEYVTIGPGMPFLSEGNSHTLDCLYSAATNKQFLSIQTKSGNVFYLVIDYDKPIDEENELYETYFLNLVDERDLLALMDDEEALTPTPQIVYVTPEPTNVPVATPTPAPVEADTPEPEEKNKAGGVAALVVLALLAGGAIFYFVKNKKKGSSSRPSNPYAFDEDDDEGDENSNE